MSKQTNFITKAILDKTLEKTVAKILGKVALREDFEAVDARLAKMGETFSAMVTTLDGYVKRTEVWHDEMAVLRISHRRLKDVLVRKGVVSDSELAV